MKVEYSSNNSGGSFWLSDDDWKALEDGGWKVQWFADVKNGFMRSDENGRWLGALATTATREGLTLGMAIAEFEMLTGQRAADSGCSCCGPPHSFEFTDDDGKSHYFDEHDYDDDDDYWSPDWDDDTDDED